MPDRNDLLLGQIAVERALVAPEQLEEALREQDTQTPPMPLGAILVARGLLTGEQLLDLVDEHRRRLASAPTPGFGSRYAIRGEIARGGMGIILDGTDVEIRRELAIKVLPPPYDADPESRVRFLEEAQIQGQLEHPNICPVHELGKKADGKPFFTMKKVKGRSLAQLFDSLRRSLETSTGREMSLPRLLEIFTKACDAIAFAHSRGVIHRDLKPGNIMLGEFGEVLVMDWGLAKVGGRPESRDAKAVVSDRAEQGVELSLDGSVMGTPSYMPPEQAEGRLEAIDERSDIYSLGAILYEILTLRPPVEGSSVTEVLARASRGDIIPPSRRTPGRVVPADLEAAALKALARRPEDRYSTVRDLREDITAYLEGRTMAAVEYTALQVAAKWFRRNRVFATTAAAAAALLLAGGVFYLVNVTKARDRAEAATKNAVREAARARAKEREAKLETAKGLVAQGDAKSEAGRWGEARAQFAGAADAFRDLDVTPLAAEIGLQQAFRRSPPPLLSMSEAGLYGAAVSPDGRLALVAGEDYHVRLWDLATGRAVRVLTGHSKPVWNVAFCPDGRRAVSSSWDGTLKLWDLDSGKLLGSFVGHEGIVLGVAVSPDGRRVASGASDGTLRTWELETGRQIRKVAAHGPKVYGVAYSSDGTRLLTGGADGRLRLWDAASGAALLELPGHAQLVSSVAFSPDGRRAVSSSWDQTAKIWDLESGSVLHTLRGHTNSVWRAAFSPDGGSIITGGNDDVVRIWDAGTGQERMSLVGHRDDVYAVAFLPDGRRVLSASYDGAIKVWNVDVDPMAPVQDPADIQHVAVSPDGRLALSAGADGSVRLWDVATGRRLRPLPPHAGAATAVAFLPDGRRALTAGADGVLRLIDLEKGTALHRLEGHRASVRGIALTRDGRRAVSGGEDRTVRVWDLEHGRESKTIEAGESPVHVVAFLPGDRQVLSAGMDFNLRIWDAETGQAVRAMSGIGAHGVFGISVSADGSRVLFGAGRDPSLGVWDLRSERLLRPFPGHTAAVFAVAPFGNGAFAVSGGADRTLRIWDAETGVEIRAIPCPSGPVRSVAVSPDERWVLAAAGRELQRWLLSRPDDPELEARMEKARTVLASAPDDAPSLAILGEWHAFRGSWAIAADLLRRARAGGTKVSPLLVGRCLWRAGNLREAASEFERALAEREAPAFYLERCLEALR